MNSIVLLQEIMLHTLIGTHFEEYKKQAAIAVADPSENTGNDTDSSGGGSGGFGGMSSF